MTATATLSRDARVLGLISGGHFISHFYQLCLPPLLLVWRAEFGASFAALGAVITLFALATGLAQIPAGILVDRFGARPFLVGGLIIVGGAIAAMGLATSLEMVYLLALIAGFGNSIFHPADYAILNSSIGSGRIGKAFGIHTFSGHLGGAVAPATIIFLTAAFDWRAAMMIAGLFSLVAAVLILAQGGVLKDENRAGAGAADQAEAGQEGNPSTLKLMLSRGMLMFFLFFLIASMTTSGVHSFSVVALVNIQGIGLASASSALTAFLFASALGILLGGVIADRFGRHDETAIIAFIVSGIVFVVVAQAGLQMVLVVALFTIAGLAQGILRPARDMMVRAMAPKGAVGRVFGYVSTGIALGSGIAPVLFGWMVDKGVSAWIFWLLAGLSLLGILIVLVQKRSG
ncbi:MAG: MFS transporter [Rhodospirillales bacterium]|jgi:MFS family permease|nr:MFS transporter [Rhodospirillales bacterium]